MKTSNTTALVERAFSLFNVSTFYQLQRAYTREDQRLMKADLWDPDDPGLLTNQTKHILEKIDPMSLSESNRDREWWHEILWFWYHHATSVALTKLRSRERARQYSIKAVELQRNDNPVTKLFWLLLHDQHDTAIDFVSGLPEATHVANIRTCIQVLQEYQSGLWPK